MGIIDFVRLYTWDKMVEMYSKKMIIKTGTTPTIVSAKNYSERFYNAMNSYFISVPKWKFNLLIIINFKYLN